MNRKIRSTRWHTALRTLPVLFLLIASLAIASLVFVGYRPGVTPGVVRAAMSPTIVSDQADYPPGATVILTGAGWVAGETVQIYVNDNVGNTWSLTSGQNGAAPSPQADGTGAFTFSFSLPTSFVASYAVTATGSSGDSATTTFTDSAVDLFDQCANYLGAGYPTPPPAHCQWTNGALQHTNSTYFEGDATVQFVELTGLAPGSTHNITLQFQTTKSAKHAYDFLTNWDWSENWITRADQCQGIAGCTSWATSTWPIPQDPNIPAAYQNGPAPSGNANRVFTMYNGTLTDATTPAIVSGSYSGDSLTQIVVSFNVPTTAQNCTSGKNGGCPVALIFGAHVARQADWGAGNGAENISGAPYHVVLAALDGASVGNRDNQLQASAIGGTITIVKVAVPKSSQTFNFNLSGDFVNKIAQVNNNFSLYDDGSNKGNSQSFSVPPSSDYTAQESSPLPNWTLTNIVCAADSFSGSSATTSLGAATASINLASGGAVTCTYTNTRVNKDLTVTKTATASFTRAYKWTISKSVDQTQHNIAAGGSATFNYTVSVSHDSGTDSAWQVNGTITVKNPNGVDFTGVNVTDDGVTNGGSCSVTNGTGLTVPANGSVEVSYTCTYPSSGPTSNSGTNKATASWDGTKYNTPDSSASGSDGFTFDDGSKGNPTIADGCVSVSDPLDSASPHTFCVGDTGDPNFSFTYSHTFSGDPRGTCTTHNNTATFTTNTTSATGSASASVKVCVGADLQVSKTATPSFTRTYTWGIAKSIDQTTQTIAAGGAATFNYTVAVTHDNGTDSAWQVSGKITVSNPNDFEDIVANVTDAVDNGGSCTVTGGNATVPKSGSVTLDYSCTYGSAPSASSGTNIATASWDKATYNTPDGSASGQAGFGFTTPTTLVDDKVTVSDPNAPNPPLPATVSSTDPSPTTFTYAHTFTGDPGGTCTTHPNTATFTTNTTGTTGSASQSVQVCVGLDLTVSKTANPTFTRTYNWSIAKSVDKPFLDPGGTAIYKVTVTETGVTDSGWQVNGTITVANPNDFEPITLTGVKDVVDNGGSCSITSGSTTATIAASGNVTLSYTCTYSSAPTSSSGTNTATASWDQTAAATPDGSAQGTKTFAFTTPTTTVNKSVTVTDSYGGTLGSATATDDATSFTVKAFTYTRKFTPPASGCQTVNNTATIVETGQSASASVQNCNSGALTMGFWQNKNGQGIISGGASTGGVCNSGTWLRKYAPFQDLSATATCSQVATYVYNVIKLATCSGTTQPCNAMLKAQMLATALDVYFSDPALGGNQIKAPAPIGGLTLDLTMICSMVDSSSGGSCSSSFENVSGAFGGATSLTVSQMLAYAAGQSNAGGSTWYGNVKATQVLAKDAFDAINNQVAFAP